MRKKDKSISYTNINCKVLRGEKTRIKIPKNSEEQKNRIERRQRKKKLKGQENRVKEDTEGGHALSRQSPQRGRHT